MNEDDLRAEELPLGDLIGKLLKPFPSDLPRTWTLWQHKTLNIHRGIIHWDQTANAATMDKARDEVRHVVQSRFRPTWLRGFGFGAVITMSEIDDSYKNVADLIDARNNSKGTWQWIVLYLPVPRAALGVCTWTEGYLAPVYQDILARLRKSGHFCESHKKDMDAVLKALSSIRKLSPTYHALRAMGLD